jgi:diguanylate cyclase (GGDEF)-like protein
MMPRVSGFEILKTVKETSELIEVILLTGELPDKVKPAVAALQNGAHDYLIKPVSISELKLTVHNALEKQRHRMESKHSLQELIRAANTDYLTGLSSRSHFCSQLNLEFELSKRHDRSLSCLVFDVDGFKKINDELSHRCGDLVLQGLGALLTSNSRVTDLKCRYGGDEFVLILPETDEVGSMRFAEKLRCLVEKERFDLVQRPFSITISLGIATYWGRNFHSADELIHAADMALILAKREGRNCIRFFRTMPSLVPSSVSSTALSPGQ